MLLPKPMWRCFNKTADHQPFNALPNNIDLNLKNTRETAMSWLSETFNFEKEDSVPDDLFNKVIWAAIRGEDSPCPAPVRAAFFSVRLDEDDND